jgi:hypothetical protein
VIELNWEPIARAVACSLEVERLNGRGAFLDENSLRRTLAQHFQSVTTAIVEPEYNHPDIPGNKRLDVVGFGPQKKKIEFAVESKWIKEGGGTRDWPLEVAQDIFRLERLTAEMSQMNDRILVVGGIRERVDSGLLEKKKNHDGKRISWVDALLPVTKASTARTLKVRDCHSAFDGFFKDVAGKVGFAKLPISFQAQLKAHYRVDDSDKDCVEVYVWRINRTKKRQEFTPTV